MNRMDVHVVNSRDVKRHIFQGLVRWAEVDEGCRSPRIHEKKLVVVSDESNARTDGGLLGTEALGYWKWSGLGHGRL